MTIDWLALNRVLSPIKNDKDLIQRYQVSFGYGFVRESFNFTMPQLAHYTTLSVGSDPRNRYEHYAAALINCFDQLHHAGVMHLIDLITRVETRSQYEHFVYETNLEPVQIAEVLKFLVYWFVPMQKHTSGLVTQGQPIIQAFKVVREIGLSTNLDILQQGLTPAQRELLAQKSGLPEATILDMVNRADLSRMPWASKATISNIAGAGYGSISRLANADPQQLYADFFRYGLSIGKNLKLGNEIENSHRIAKIVPVLVQER